MPQVYYDYDQLTSAYEHASAHNMPQVWRNALNKGFDLLLASDAIAVVFGPMGGILLARIPSQSEPGLTHTVNGHCDCEAGARGKPCAHRAAKRLLSIASEQAAAKQVRTVEQARTLGTHRDGTPMRVSREQAFAEMAELFAD
jgi:hypothetical protein